MKSIRELRVTQSYFFSDVTVCQAVAVVYQRADEVNQQNHSSQSEGNCREKQYAFTHQRLRSNSGSALHSLHIVTNTSFAYQVAEKKPQTNGGVQVGTVEHHKGRLPSPPPTRLFYRQLECCQKIFRRHMVSQYLLS